jgi:hypothetical protein
LPRSSAAPMAGTCDVKTLAVMRAIYFFSPV